MSLMEAGYQCLPVTGLASDSGKKAVFLRHDIDLHLSGVDELARIEARMGVKATYYVLLTSHYNVLCPDNRKILQDLLGWGHEVGLHYDMETYPEDVAKARNHLEEEVELLSRMVGRPIFTISMHQPHLGKSDPFRQLKGYLHPHDPRYGENLLYISDSCRAWRDERLLACFGDDPPRRVLLSVHPELWLDGTVTDRMVYLDQVLMKNGLLQMRRYYEETVRRIWETHPATTLHDGREVRIRKKEGG